MHVNTRFMPVSEEIVPSDLANHRHVNVALFCLRNFAVSMLLCYVHTV